MAIEPTQRVYVESRAFFETEEGQMLLAWLKEQKPKIIGDTLEAAALSGKEAAGYELCLARLQEFIETNKAEGRTPDEERELRR
jgi:hypothetical protein